MNWKYNKDKSLAAHQNQRKTLSYVYNEKKKSNTEKKKMNVVSVHVERNVLDTHNNLEVIF